MTFFVFLEVISERPLTFKPHRAHTLSQTHRYSIIKLTICVAGLLTQTLSDREVSSASSSTSSRVLGVTLVTPCRPTFGAPLSGGSLSQAASALVKLFS